MTCTERHYSITHGRRGIQVRENFHQNDSTLDVWYKFTDNDVMIWSSASLFIHRDDLMPVAHYDKMLNIDEIREQLNRANRLKVMK